MLFKHVPLEFKFRFNCQFRHYDSPKKPHFEEKKAMILENRENT